MRIKITVISLLIFISLFSFQLNAKNPSAKANRQWTAGMQWFKQAKLGIFIHWGLYSVNGIAESWSLPNKTISFEDYLAQAKRFTASKYDPNVWAKLFKEAGARYAVLTTKHHDGFALWPTKYSHFNVVEKTPAHRDLIGPYAQALRKEGLKVGLYFSLSDWSHPDYTPVNFSRKGVTNGPYPTNDYPREGQENLTPWQRFIIYYQGQLKELMTRYHPDLLWFDGWWEHSAKEWQSAKVRAMLKKYNPDLVINSRLRDYGDYETPEQGLPIYPPKGPWEFCMTINDSWGWQPKDTNFKSSYQIIRTFVECISKGGNLLLDVGPKEDGTIPEPEVRRLKDLGRWIHKHKEAVYPTQAGFSCAYYYGPSTISADSQIVYLYLVDRPGEYVELKGLQNKINSIHVVGRSDTLQWKRSGGAPWANVPGIVLISVPENELDPFVTVLALELKGKLKLYRPNNKKN